MMRASPVVLLVCLSACASVVSPPATVDAPDGSHRDALDPPDTAAPPDVSVAPPVDASAVDAPGASTCATPAAGTFDCDTRAIAEAACGRVLAARRPCHVCVQNAAADGRPTRWSAIESDYACGCPAPRVDAPDDAGAAGDANDGSDALDAPLADDGGACASAAVTPDCGTEAIARGVCNASIARGTPCHVCIQRTTQTRLPLLWMAVHSPDSCACEAPQVLVACGGVYCVAPELVCVFPATPGDCGAVDGGACAPGCPGCPPRTSAATCAPASRVAACAPDDCECHLRAYCPGAVGRCRGSLPTGLMIDCEAP